MCHVNSLSTSEEAFIHSNAYNKAFSWASALNLPMFSITVDSYTSILDGWFVNGTLTVPGTEIVGYSVYYRRKPSNGRVGGSPITIVYASDLL